MKTKYIIKRVVAIILVAVLIVGVIPANTIVFATPPTSSLGTNTSVTMLKNSTFRSASGIGPAYTEEKVIFAITPYSLGDDEHSAGNILNSYILGQKNGKAFTKEDLIYTKDVEVSGSWGYTLKDLTADKYLHNDSNGKKVKTGIFLKKHNKQYIPQFGDSLDTLMDTTKETKLGNVTVTINGYDNNVYPIETEGEKSSSIKLLETLYPEYKYSFTRHQQYWANVGSSIFNTQPLRKSSLLFVSGELVKYNFADYIWYANNTEATGKYKKYGYDSDTSNIIYGKYTWPSGSVNSNAKPKAGLANGEETDKVAKRYTANGDKASSGSKGFMKDVIHINSDGGVFYDWLTNTVEIWDYTEKSDKNNPYGPLEEIHEEKYYYDTKSNTFKVNNKLDDEKVAFKKVSVGPQINWDNLAKVPAQLDELLRSNSSKAKSLVTEALTLWQYILYYNSYIDSKGYLHTGDTTPIQDKVRDFLTMGCEHTVNSYIKKGSRGTIPKISIENGVATLKKNEEGSKIIDLFNEAFDDQGSWSGFYEAAGEYFEFVTNLYNTHYLDLLICAYVCAYNNDPSSEATKVWREVLEKYCTPEKNNWSANECSIQITPVAIAHGLVVDSSEFKTVYVAAQDYVMLVYGMDEAGSVENDSESTLNKAFFGYDINSETTSIVNPFTTKTKANLSDSNTISFNGIKPQPWVYYSFYTKLKNSLVKNIKSINSYNNIDNIHSSSHFGASGTINRVFKYMFKVNKNSKNVEESLTRNDWGRLGGVIGSLAVRDTDTFTVTRDYINKIYARETVGNNIIIAYQWENCYQVMDDTQNETIKLSFIKKSNDDNKKMTINFNSNEETKDYTIKKEGSEFDVTFKTETRPESTAFYGITKDKFEKEISEANLNLGTQAYIKEIRINGKKASEKQLEKLLDKDKGLQLSGTALDYYDVTENNIYDYVRSKNGERITKESWITTAKANQTNAGKPGVGYYTNQVKNIYDILKGNITINGTQTKEKLSVSFGSNFQPSTNYEIDIAYKRQAALGGKYSNGKSIPDVFLRSDNKRIESNEIILTIQYTPSTAEYRIVGYDIDTGYILGWSDPKELTLGSETKEEFKNGIIKFDNYIKNVEFTIANKEEAESKGRPTYLFYMSESNLTNYDDVSKKASGKTDVKQKKEGNNQVFIFTADKASSYTYLFVPIKLNNNLSAATLNIYYSIKDGNVVYAEQIPSNASTNKFKTQVTGVDGLTYNAVINKDYLSGTYTYECINPSSDAKLEINLIQLAAGKKKNTDSITFEDVLKGIKAKTVRRIDHKLDITKQEWSVTKENDKKITSMLWIPVDSSNNDVPVTVYYVDTKDTTKVLKTVKKENAKKGYAYSTNIETEMVEDGMQYEVDSIEGYYTVTKSASKLKSYSTAKTQSSITVTRNDSELKISKVPSDNIDVMAIYVLMVGGEIKHKETYISKPEAYAELKEGSISYNAALNKNIFNETFEAMAGVPSTEALYFTTGGSEFIVQLSIESTRETAERKYESLFRDIDCQFKITDSLQGGTTGTKITKNFSVNDTSGSKTTSTTVPTLAEIYNMVNPIGASSYNTTFSSHTSDSREITATWTGTITNADTGAKPSDHKQAVGWNPGPSNNAYVDLCATEANSNAYAGTYGNPGSMGTERNNDYNWNVSAYNTALRQAYEWAKQLEEYSNANGNVLMIANSDGVTRSFHLGDAVIEIKLENVSHSGENGSKEVVNVQPNGTWYNAVQRTDTKTWESYQLKSHNDERLGTTWREKYGAVAVRGSSGGCVKSCWELAKYNQRPMITVSYISSYSGSSSNPVTSEYDDPDEVTYDDEGNEISRTKGAHHVVYGIECSHAPVTSTFQYRESWCGATSETHTDATHSMGSGGTDSYTPCSTTSGSFSVHTCTHSCGSWTPLVETEAVQMGTVTYTIKVTFKNSYVQADGNKYLNETVNEAKKSVPNGILPAHALCGPCCNHHLPAIEDTWTQEFEFRTMVITAMKVWRLDKGYVTGMDEITENSDETLISTGDIIQNLFYNIASTPTSAAGRLRYSLQTGQDDHVFWDEYTSETKHVKQRTNLCDGLGKTVSSYNPYPNGGKGHEEDYAYGCLYTSSNFENGVDTHKRDGSLNTKYTNLVSDERDRKTEEWQRFDMRRNLDVTITVISDFLILQTTSGDESIVYHDASQKVKAQENPDELIKVQWSEIYTNNPLVRKGNEEKDDPGRILNVGSYNGLYQLVDVYQKNKYTGTGNGAKISTRFDDSPVTSAANDGDKDYYNGTYANKDIKEDGTTINLAEVKVKRTVKDGTGYISSPGRSETRLNRPTKPLLISLNNIKQKITNPNKEYVTGQSYAFFEEILAYDRDGGTKWFFETATDNVVNKKGYTMPSIYTKGQTKINNIVVHDPVSVVSARILEPTVATDQRVTVNSNTASLNKMLETMAKCPRNPADCVNRMLECTFFSAVTLAKFDIDKHDSVIEDDSQRTYIIDSENGIRLLSSDSGFTVKEENGNSYLSANGKAELPIYWSKISLDTESDLTSVSVAADIKLSDAAETLIFKTDNAVLKTLSSNKLQLELGNGDVYISTMTLSKNTKYTIELVLSNGALTLNTNYIKINGTKIALTKTVNGTNSVFKPYLGDGLVIGYDDADSTIAAPKYIDNLIITRMPGTTYHTDACYIEDDGIKELICTDPHHQKDAYGNPLHYDYSNEICYKACNNDQLHQESAKTTDSNGQRVTLANHIFLDNYFQVYYANKGDFAEDPTLHGIAKTTQVKGKGYVNDMDTTKWLREKWIMFSFAVLYYRESTGKWEQHEAGEYFQLDKNYEYYNFYCLLKNNEYSQAIVEFVSEAINNEEPCTPGNVVKSQDCPSDNRWATNAERFSNLTAYHSAYKKYYVDVIGRIGNLIIEDTNDVRYTNFFKQAKKGDFWYVDGLLKQVDSNIQKNFLTWLGGTDIRGQKLSALIEKGIGLNTYGTLPWATGTESYTSSTKYTAGAASLPLSSDKNNIKALSANNLKLGYKILWDISTIGNYESGNVEVKPYVYALNIKSGALTPVDVYMETDSGLVPINYFGLFEETEAKQKELLNKLGNYAFYLDWTESGRRNYTSAEQIATANVQANRRVPLYDINGEPVVREVYHPASDTREVYMGTDSDGNPIYELRHEYVPEYVEEVFCYREIQAPSGKYNLLGNLQLLSASETARTFIGSSKVSGIYINGKEETELIDSTGEQWRYNEHGQRWHLYIGLPSNSVFVPFTDGVHYAPYTVKTDTEGNEYYIKDEITADNNDYVFLLTVDITAFGDVFNVHYDQNTNGTFTTTDNEGNTVTWNLDGRFDTLPTLLAVYQGRSNVDISIKQTH